jgi:hypothetical protein
MTVAKHAALGAAEVMQELPGASNDDQSQKRIAKHRFSRLP